MGWAKLFWRGAIGGKYRLAANHEIQFFGLVIMRRIEKIWSPIAKIDIALMRPEMAGWANQFKKRIMIEKPAFKFRCLIGKLPMNKIKRPRTA